MKTNNFLSKNTIFKKLDTIELKKINLHKDNKNINIINNFLNDSTEENIKIIYKDLKLKSFNDKTVTKKPNNKNRKSNLISLTKSTNYFKTKNKTYKCSKDVKLMADSGNINLNFNSYIINSKNPNVNSKNKNRYLTCFENIENSNSIKTDENKINNLLNDFIVPNTNTNTEGNITESKNKENININLNEEKKEKNNNDNFLIKVNKKKLVTTNNNHPKNFYIQACLKLKEKMENNENNDKNKTEIKSFKELNRNNFLKISKLNSERKRNTSNFIKIKHYKQNFCVDKENNINRKPRTGHSIATIYKPSNSFRVNEKKLFLNNNYLKKQMTKPLILDTFKENKKSKNKSCFEKEEIKTNTIKLSNTIINYEQRKITVQKTKSPNPFKRQVKLYKAPISIENNNAYNNHNFENTIRIKSEENEDKFSDLSYRKQNNNSNNIKSIVNNNLKDKFYFSLDLTLNNKNENNKSANQKLISPKSVEKRERKFMSSINKDKRISKNADISNFNFDELNQKLFKMIRKIESHDEKRKERKNSDKKDGFIKWDIFEKAISEEI